MAIDKATSVIAGRIQGVVDRLANADAGLTNSEAHQIAATLAAEVRALQSIGDVLAPHVPIPAVAAKPVKAAKKAVVQLKKKK